MRFNKVANEAPYVIDVWWHRLLRVLIYGSTAIFFMLVSILIVSNADYKTYTYIFESEFFSVVGEIHECEIDFKHDHVGCGNIRTLEKLISCFLKAQESLPMDNTFDESFALFEDSYTFTAQVNGKEIRIPILVPTVTRDELKQILSLKQGEPPSDSVLRKAIEEAKARIEKGLPVFATKAEVERALEYFEFKRMFEILTARHSSRPRYDLSKFSPITYGDLIQSLRQKGWSDFQIGLNLFGNRHARGSLAYKTAIRWNQATISELLKDISTAMGISIIWFAVMQLFYKSVLFIAYGHTRVIKK